MPNTEVLLNNLHPVQDEADVHGLWETFIGLSSVCIMKWYPNAGFGFQNINFSNENPDELYIFTQLVPRRELVSFFTDRQIGRPWEIGGIDLMINRICELELTENHEPYFWKRVVEAIKAKDNNEIEHLGERYNAGIDQFGALNGIFQPRPFNDIIGDLNREILERNNEVFDFVGRIFLISIDIGNTFLEANRRYAMFAFFDQSYFRRTFLDEMGLECMVSDLIN